MKITRHFCQPHYLFFFLRKQTLASLLQNRQILTPCVQNSHALIIAGKAKTVHRICTVGRQHGPHIPPHLQKWKNLKKKNIHTYTNFNSKNCPTVPISILVLSSCFWHPKENNGLLIICSPTQTLLLEHILTFQGKNKMETHCWIAHWQSKNSKEEQFCFSDEEKRPNSSTNPFELTEKSPSMGTDVLESPSTDGKTKREYNTNTKRQNMDGGKNKCSSKWNISK